MSGEAQGHRGAFDGELLDAATVLLLAPSIEPADDEGCGHLFDAAGEVDGVLHVTLVQPPVRRLRRWREHTTSDPPERVGVVGLRPGGGDGTEGIPVPDGPAPARVEWVSQPPDLTRLCVATLEFLDEWADEGRLAVCVHSLTVLLQYADLERVFRFCHAFATRVREAGATAHFHLDPSAVDGRTVGTVRQLFDATVRATDEGFVRD